MTTKETCIRRNKRTDPYEYSAANGTFWLSSVGINLRDLYEVSSNADFFLKMSVIPL